MTSKSNFMREASGSIVKITLQNFLTYDYIEFTPRAEFNVILSPCGIGGFSLFHAIRLGLNGNPKDVENVSNYIKYGCDKATILIELFNDYGRNYVIKKEITRMNTSLWKLNENITSQKSIEDLLFQLNIQVDNLILSQHKIDDLTKMTNQELVEFIEKSVGDGKNMIQHHYKFKDLQEKLRNYDTVLENDYKKLEFVKQINLSFEERIEKMDYYEAQIKHLKTKLLWMEYNEQQQKFKQMKNHKQRLTQDLTELEKQILPFINQMAEIKLNVQNDEQTINQLTQTISQELETVTSLLKDIKAKENEIARAKENKITRDRATNFEKTKSLNGCLQIKIEKHKIELHELMLKLETVCANIQSYEEIDEKIKTTTESLIAIKNEIESALVERNQISFEIREKTLSMNYLSSKHNVLQLKHGHAYRANLWLQKNSGRFKRKIYAPMMTLINVTQSRMATYVESHISFEDIFAFVCEDIDDMNEFLKEMRDQQKLSIKVIYEPPEHQSPKFKPDIPISKYKKYGLTSYLKSLFTAPGPIVNYLCRHYNIHNVPIGNFKTEIKINNIFSETTFLCVYSDTHKYQKTESKTTGLATITSTKLMLPEIFKKSANTEMFRQMENEFKSLENGLVLLNRSLKEKQSQRDDLVVQIKNLEKQKDNLKSTHIEQVSAYYILRVKIILEEEAIRFLKGNLESEENLTIEEITNRKSVMLRDAYNVYQNIVEMKIKKTALIDKIQNESKDKQGKITNKVLELILEAEKRLKILAGINCDLIEARKSTMEMLEKVTFLSGVSKDFYKTSELQKVLAFLLIPPSTVPEIMNSIFWNQANLNTLSASMDIDKYRYNKKKIEALEFNLKRRKELVNQFERELEFVFKKLWISNLDRLVKSINLNFERYLKSLGGGYMGEVVLEKEGENSKDETYALCFNIKYRDGNRLRKLQKNNIYEKRLTMILLVLALQETTRMPFFCLNEIQQGLDSTHEKKLFELLADISCGENAAQYFFLTPKMLPNLTVNDKMIFHTIQ